MAIKRRQTGSQAGDKASSPSTVSRFPRSAFALAMSSLWLLPVLSSQAAGPGPIAGEFQVNTLTPNNQSNSAVAIDADGDFVVAWQSLVAGNYDIRAQRYNAAGVAQGSEIVVAANPGNQARPAVAMDANGDFVVAWDSFFTGDNEIRAQRFNAAGNPQGPELGVNTVTADQQLNPSVAIDADGDFVVAWQSGASSYYYDIRARRFNAAGVAQGGEINVNTFVPGPHTAPAVALDADGDFVVTWYSQYGGGYEIKAQRYNAAGVAQGGEITVDGGNAPNLVRTPSVALDADGDFVVAWRDGDTGNFEISARRYSAAGLAQGGEFSVNTVTTGNQERPSVAMAADGDFVVTWDSFAIGDTEIRARRYFAAGVADGGEFQVNTLTTSGQFEPDVALDADGDFLVAWHSNVSGSYDIRARRYQGPDPVDVSLFQTDSADPAPVGSPLIYTLSAGNLQAPVFLTGIAAIDNALGAATGLRIVDTLPVGSTAVSATGTNWTCTLPAGRVVCDYGLTLLPGDQASSVIVTLTPPNAPGTVINNVARAFANQFDENVLNNREVETTQLVCAESVIELSASEYSVVESADFATLTATRSGGACGVARVQFDTTGSSATAGLDFADVTGTLTWANGDLVAKTFIIPISNDALDEISERVLINLSGVRGASLGTRHAARLSIADDDVSPRVNFTSASQTLAEDPTLATVSVVLNTISGRDVSVPLSYGGTATSGTDYASGVAALTIPAGQTSASTQIEIAEDTATEASETIIVGMGAVSGATVGTINPHTITITDDDVAAAPTVSFDVATANANEATATTVHVQLSAASAQTVTVPYTRSATATFTTDYSLSLPSPITFNPGEVDKLITITPVDDAIDEPNENARLTLGTPTNATLGALTMHTRTIVDNDPCGLVADRRVRIAHAENHRGATRAQCAPYPGSNSGCSRLL